MSKTLQRIACPGLHSQQPASQTGNRAGIDVKTIRLVFMTGNSSPAGKALWETRNDPC
jgi:hypothetical protein